MERLLRPITEALLAHANIEGCSNALDVGCGGGSQSMILAERLGANAKVLGVDISEPMLRVARKKSEEQKANQAQVEFLQADAPNAPGPFAFADAERLRSILVDSGFSNIGITSHRMTMCFGEAATLGESVRELAKIGPVASLLAGQDRAVLETVFAAIEDVLEPYYSDGGLNLPAAIWMVTAGVA